MSEGRSNFGYALNSRLGLVMVGGEGDSDTFPSESTQNGIKVDNRTAAGFPEKIYANCLVNVNETTVISFGGYPPSVNGRKIAVYTIGDKTWKVIQSTIYILI